MHHVADGELGWAQSEGGVSPVGWWLGGGCLVLLLGVNWRVSVCSVEHSSGCVACATAFGWLCHDASAVPAASLAHDPHSFCSTAAGACEVPLKV
jgi:hypothetical protein